MTVPASVTRNPRLAGFALGMIAAVLGIWLGIAAGPMMKAWTGDPGFTAEYPRLWFSVVNAVLACLPLIVLAGMTVARLAGRPWSQPLACLGGIATVYVGIVALLVDYSALARPANERDFDSAAWRANAPAMEGTWPPRLRMIDDLLLAHQLEGLRREQVEQLLGPSDPHHGWEGWHMVYRLGSDRSWIFPETEYLALRLDADGRVIRHEILRDDLREAHRERGATATLPVAPLLHPRRTRSALRGSAIWTATNGGTD